jgi:hypothetical protein
VACLLSANSGHHHLFDHFVGAFEQRPRHCDTQWLRGLEIDHHLVLGWRLHRQIARLLAFEDAVELTGCVPKLVIEIWPIRDQSAGGGKEVLKVDRGQFVPAGSVMMIRSR